MIFVVQLSIVLGLTLLVIVYDGHVIIQDRKDVFILIGYFYLVTTLIMLLTIGLVAVVGE